MTPFFFIPYFFLSYFPNIVMTEQELKIDLKPGGSYGLTYQHQIPWDKIVRIDSGGGRMIQWSPNTSIYYHTGKVPLGHSSDVAEAVISNSLGNHNYCRILTLATQKAKNAKVDPLTFHLIQSCSKNTWI